MSLGIGLDLPRRRRGSGVPFSFGDFMNGQSNGLYIDFTKTDRHQQISTGGALVAAIADPIGLAWDQRTWGSSLPAAIIAAQPELITGAWTMSVAGGTSTATESPAGQLNLSGDGVNAARGDHSFATVAGRTYAVTATVATNNVTAQLGTTQGGSTLLNAGWTVGVNTFYMVATATTTWLRFSRIVVLSPTTITAISAKLVPGNHAVVATTTMRPLLQAAGAKFDGADDYLRSVYAPGVGANFLVAHVTFPASITGTLILAGANDAASANRFWLGADATAVRAGIGSQNGTVIFGATAPLNKTIAVGITIDGATTRLFVDGAVEYEAAQAGTPTTTIPIMIGANNSNGTVANWFGVTVKRIAAGREFLSLGRYLQIRAAMAAA